MSPRQFESENQARWAEFESMVERLEKGKPADDVTAFPGRLRQLCQDLNLAQHRVYGARLSDRLNQLVIRGYSVLSRGLAGGWDRFLRLLAVSFPAAVRREARLFWFCMIAFWAPFLSLAIFTSHDPDFTMTILGPEQMESLDQMYGPGKSPVEHLRERYGSDFMMFCFYIYHNVGIDFQTFAGGIFGGVGSLFILLFNSAALGASVGYVRHTGNPETFFTFVSGHSAPELMGIVVSAMAGLRLGLALVAPGRYDRGTALVLAGKNALPLLGGAGFLTTWAAVIEGFWSAQPLDPAIKYAFGGVMWLLVFAYLGLAGRRSSRET